MIIGGVGGVAILALVLGLTLGGDGGDGGGGNKPKPIIGNYNPYKVDEGSLDTQVNEISGVINADSDVEEVLASAQRLQKVLGNGAKVSLVDPKTIPYGKNN